MYTVETPDVRFEDVLEVITQGDDFNVQIDPLFLEACESNSIDVIGLVPSTPSLLGATINDGQVRIRTKRISHFPEVPDRIRVTISGVRKGSLSERFRIATEQEVIRNSIFWNLSTHNWRVQ
jgi:hypothetical protein